MELHLEAIQRIGFELLVEFKQFCEKNGLRYYICFGTLIGAVRHQGFIPWDDDIDVIMPRPDFERFQQLYADHGRYKLFSCRRQKNYLYPYLKLCDATTYSVLANGTKNERGVGIDIFALDGQGDNYEQEKARFQKLKRIFFKSSFMAERMNHLNPSGKASIVLKKSIAKLMFTSGIANFITKQIDRQLSGRNYADCDMVSTVQDLYASRYRQWDKSRFGDGCLLQFQNEWFTAPLDYAGLLTDLYGDYMTPPPVEKRATTHFEKYFSE